MKTYKCGASEVKQGEQNSYIIGEHSYTQEEFRHLVKNNLGARPKYKRALTIIYEVIFEDVKSSIVEIVNPLEKHLQGFTWKEEQLDKFDEFMEGEQNIN